MKFLYNGGPDRVEINPADVIEVRNYSFSQSIKLLIPFRVGVQNTAARGVCRSRLCRVV